METTIIPAATDDTDTVDLLYELHRRDEENAQLKIYLLCELLRLGRYQEFEQVIGFGDDGALNKSLWSTLEGLQALATVRGNPLDALALKYGTDKSSHFHNFARYYFQFFLPLRKKAKKVLEIGIEKGASLKMWAEFFPSAVIYGIDNDPKSFQEQSDKIRTFTGSQEDRSFMQGFLSKVGGGFDIIIDDGGHRMREQLVTMQTLLPAVVPGGFYVLEDLHTSYWDFCGGGHKKQGTAIETLKDMIDELNLFGRVDCGDPARAVKALKERHPDLTLRYLEEHLHAMYFFKSIAFLLMR